MIGIGLKYSLSEIPHKKIYWQVEYLANRSVIIVGVTLIWRRAVAAIHINSFKKYIGVI